MLPRKKPLNFWLLSDCGRNVIYFGKSLKKSYRVIRLTQKDLVHTNEGSLVINKKGLHKEFMSILQKTWVRNANLDL